VGPEHRKPRPGDPDAKLLGDGSRPDEVRLRGEQRELLAAVARQEVAVAELFLHQARDALEHGVAGRVAELVVQALEVVDVDEGEGERLVGAVGALRLPGELVLEVAVVVEPREAVGERELGEHLVSAPQRLVLGAQPAIRLFDGGALALELEPALPEPLREVVEGAGGGPEQEETEGEAHRGGEEPRADVDGEVADLDRRRPLEHPQREAGRHRDGDRGRQGRPEEDEPDPEREAPKPRGRLRMHLSSSREGAPCPTLPGSAEPRGGLMKSPEG
jgi:hypothetical protein